MKKELSGCSENKIRLLIKAKKISWEFQTDSKLNDLEKYLHVFREQRGRGNSKILYPANCLLSTHSRNQEL